MLRGWTAINDDGSGGISTPGAEDTAPSTEPKPTETGESTVAPGLSNGAPEAANGVQPSTEITPRDIGESLEVQEAQANKLYSDALGLLRSHGHGTKEWTQCKELFEQVLEMRIVQSCSVQDQYSLVPRIKYCCLRNLASMLEVEDQHADALQMYFAALEIDDTDVTVWLSASKVARTLGETRVEQIALENVLLLDPGNLPTISRLLEIAFVSGNVPLLHRVTSIGKALHNGPVVQAKLLQHALRILQESSSLKWPSRIAQAFTDSQLVDTEALVRKRLKFHVQPGQSSELQEQPSEAVAIELPDLSFSTVLRKLLSLCRNAQAGYGEVSIKSSVVKSSEACNGVTEATENSSPIPHSMAVAASEGNAGNKVKAKAEKARRRLESSESTAQETQRIFNKFASRFVSGALLGKVDASLPLAAVELLSRPPQDVLPPSTEDMQLNDVSNKNCDGESTPPAASVLPPPLQLRKTFSLEELQPNQGKVDLLSRIVLRAHEFVIDKEEQKLLTQAATWLNAKARNHLFIHQPPTGIAALETWESMLFLAEVAVDYSSTSSEKKRRENEQLCASLTRHAVLLASTLYLYEEQEERKGPDLASLYARTCWVHYKFNTAFSKNSSNSGTLELLRRCRDAFALSSQGSISLPHCAEDSLLDADALSERIDSLEAKTSLDLLRTALNQEDCDNDVLSQVLEKLTDRYMSCSNGRWFLKETWKEFAGFPSMDGSLDLEWLKQQDKISPFVALHVLSVVLNRHNEFATLGFLILQRLSESDLLEETGDKHLVLFMQVCKRLTSSLCQVDTATAGNLKKMLDMKVFIALGLSAVEAVDREDAGSFLNSVRRIAQYCNHSSSFQTHIALKVSVRLAQLDSALDGKNIKARSGLATEVVKYSQVLTTLLEGWAAACESFAEEPPVTTVSLNTLLNPLLRLAYMINFAIAKNMAKEPTWTKGLLGNCMLVVAWLVLFYEVKPFRTYGKLVCVLRCALESQYNTRESITQLAKLASRELSKREVVLWINQRQDRELSEDLETFRQEAMNQSYYCLYGLRDPAGGCCVWEYRSLACDPKYPESSEEVNACFQYLLPYLEGVTAFSGGFEYHDYIVELLRSMRTVLSAKASEGAYATVVEEQLQQGKLFAVDNDFFAKVESSRKELATKWPDRVSSAETLSRLHFILAEAVSAQKLVRPKSRKRGASHTEEQEVVDYLPRIQLYKADLTFNPWRIQSWFQLGLLVRDQVLNDQLCSALYDNVLTRWCLVKDGKDLPLETPAIQTVVQRLKFCIRSWFIVTKLVEEEVASNDPDTQSTKMEKNPVFALFSRVLCKIRAYQATDLPSKSTITRVNEDGTYDLTNEDDPGMEFHVGREWLTLRESWSQFRPQEATKFLGDCYEIIGNTIYSSLFLFKTKEEEYKEMLCHAKNCFEKFEQIHPKEAHVALFMKARILRKLEASITTYLPLFISSLKKLIAAGRKDGLGSGRLCKEKVLYQIYTSLAKDILRSLPVSEDLLAFAEDIIFNQLALDKHRSSSTTTKALVSDCILEICSSDRKERTANVLLALLSELKAISIWNYQAVYRQAWIIWRSLAAFPEFHGAFSLSEALDLLEQLLRKKASIKGVNILWNAKYVDFTEHIVRPAYRYHIIRLKVVRTAMAVCEDSNDFLRGQDILTLVTGISSDLSSNKLQSECLKYLIRLVQTAATGPTPSSLSKCVDRSFRLYVQAVQLAESETENTGEVESVVEQASKLLVELYTQLRSTGNEDKSFQDTLQSAINFCDRSSPTLRGKKKLSKFKLRLKKRRKVDDSSSLTSPATGDK